MRIRLVEIQNFRKLQSIQIDFSRKTTLLVGANNSGKTSAMLALGHFLVDPRRFTTHDFTLSHWTAINSIGAAWVSDMSASPPTISSWESVLPSLDLWLEVADSEIHYVSHLLPHLDWTGGLLGVRLRFEPDDIEVLFKEFVGAINTAKETKNAATKGGSVDKHADLALWPKDMRDFLDRRLRKHFSLKAYLLDPAGLRDPSKGVALPQSLLAESEPLAIDPIAGLIRIDEISAQRGLGASASNTDKDSHEDRLPRARRPLSEQLRDYYSSHLDPCEYPDPEDLDALDAIASAQRAFDGRLESGFAPALDELANLNYPGVTDPVLRIVTKVIPTDGLKHSAAVQYEVCDAAGDGSSGVLRLPEEFNGLGYQNLISMVFKLMSFRDAWMKVGKAAKAKSTNSDEKHFPPPLHLVLIEEPEAHLHVQVQQVFAKQAYSVLRNHKHLGDDTTLCTQLVVSTHSGHVAHETPFSSLRYFRRLPADGPGAVPTTAVINLSRVFGDKPDTDKFVARYLRTTHCDLFFADAAIFVEGASERILVPHFIRTKFKELNRCFITLLELGGSHAHRLRPLIEHLGLISLIITDLDSVEPSKRKAVPPQRNKNYLTGNDTLKEWHPQKSALDELLDFRDEDKVKGSDIPKFSVRVAYQKPISVCLNQDNKLVEVLATTFEDSLALENIPFFESLKSTGLAAAIRKALRKAKTSNELTAALSAAVRKADKASFALDLLVRNPAKLVVPSYINEGLTWLESQLRREKRANSAPAMAEAAGAK